MPIILDFLSGRTPPDLYAAYLSPLFETWSDLLIAQSPPSGHVLDIASGTGIVTRKLARQTNVSRVDAIDIAEPMVLKAKAMTEAELPITFQVASADALPFQDDQFDAAFCQQGLQFFPDKVGAFEEVRRVVKPGGRLTFAVWTTAKDGNPAFGALEEIVAKELGEDLIPFGPFAFGDAAAVEQTARDAGLIVSSVTRTERPSPLGDPRTLLLFDLMFLGRPGADGELQPLFDPSDASKDGQIEAMINQFVDATRPHQTPDGMLIAPMTANILIATVPD